MNGAKLGIFALTVLFGAAILVPAVLADIPSADCSFVSDYDRCGSCAYCNDVLHCRDCFLRDCDSCFRGDFDRCSVHDSDRIAAPDCRGQCATEYRCNLRGCAWIH
jgi:hypothetical protein